MIRQIFIAPLKDGLPEEKIRERINAQLALKEHVPGIREISVIKTRNLFGGGNAILMTLGFDDPHVFEELMTCEYHRGLAAAIGEYCKETGHAGVQYED